MNYSIFTTLFFLIIMIIMVGICQGSQFITWNDLKMPEDTSANDGSRGDRRVIIVSKDGKGDSRTVQGAVDMVPDGNKERVKIYIFPGVYREKVRVPTPKRYVSFIGKDKSNTIISWNSKASDRDAHGGIIGTFESATVAIEADFFCANGITFENTAPSAQSGAQGMQAVALRLSGDKAMLYGCNILGSQDTLFDNIGRHYFLNCYIQGSIDFIFGDARSLYKGCTLHATATGYGAIAASQRNSPSDDSGFSFVNCYIKGTGMIYLGRAWGRYAKIVYSYCHIDGIIVPEGWSDWGDSSRRRTVSFGEFQCGGAGAELSDRAKWSRSLTYGEAKPFLDRFYIDGNEWLRV